MFRLIKIENSGVNVPEPVKMAKEVGSKIKLGDALVAADGNVEPCGVTAAPTYIALNSADEDAKTVFCYRVHPHMLFECELSAAASGIYIGNKLKLAADTDGSVSMLAAEVGGAAEIVEIPNGLSKGARITVKFS